MAASVAKEVAKLQRMSVNDLRDRYEEVFVDDTFPGNASTRNKKRERSRANPILQSDRLRHFRSVLRQYETTTPLTI